MIKAKLKYKMLISVLLLVLTVSIAITIVVSVIVTRQNKKAVHISLDKSLVVIRDSLVEKQTAFLETIQHMATIHKLGNDAKFLIEYIDSGLDLTRNSYKNIAKSLANTAIMEKLYSARVYSKEGNLLGFFEKKSGNDLVMGFVDADTFHYRTFREGETYDQIKMAASSSIDGLSLSPKYSGSMPDKKSTSFVVAGEYLSLKTIIPLYANEYNMKTEKNEPAQFGFVVAVEQLGKGFVSRMNRITGMGMNLFVGDTFSTGDFGNYKKVNLGTVDQTLTGGWDIQHQKFHFSDIFLDDKRCFQAMLPLYAGINRIGCLLILQSDALVKSNTRQMVVMISLVALACVILVVPLASFAAGKVVTPMIRIVDKLKDIAEGEGDLTTRLEITSKDETGQVAQWFNTFIDKIHALITDVAGNAKELNNSATTLSEISRVMADGAEQTSKSSNSVSAASEEMSVSMTSVAEAMEQTSGNMGMVSAATEEMTNTINEISKNTVSAKEITDEVVEKTRDASDQIEELGNSANEIGFVVQTITDISNQVNLLALNATIEAARAGEAGKGFAVVANEIKELANQTAEATKEIKEKVENIRTSTGRTVEQIDGISNVVNKVNEIVIIIASAVEEQSATTQNISENIVQVTQGIDKINDNISQSSSVSNEIARDISGTTQIAEEMTQNSLEVDTRSKELSALSEKLEALVKKFKI
ncbi:MAG: methyl-accepting chemotaxis protein [Desulfobacula sp.]|nr:methyl-accepting chemotaxis protein [Desulfobacula sp.]